MTDKWTNENHELWMTAVHEAALQIEAERKENAEEWLACMLRKQENDRIDNELAAEIQRDTQQLIIKPIE